MKLRNASENDLSMLTELNRQLIEDGESRNPMSDSELEARMRRWLASGYPVVIFELSSEPVAYAVLRPSDEGVYLQQFFVARTHRRRGFGRRAMSLLREQIVPTGAVLTLDVFAHNKRALAFWRALGFEEVAVHFRAPQE